MAAEVVRMHTIRRVMSEFLDWKASTVDPEELSTYRQTIGLFERSINVHGTRGLSGVDREIYRGYYVRGRGYRRHYSEVFGPEKIPAEIRYFLRRYLRSEPTAGGDVQERAANVVADLCSWLVWKDYIPESDMEAAIDEIGAEASAQSQNPVNF